jgi:hypothetical protein
MSGLLDLKNNLLNKQKLIEMLIHFKSKRIEKLFLFKKLIYVIILVKMKN